VTVNCSRTMAEHAATLRFEDLPDAVVTRADKVICDELAAMIAGSRFPVSEAVARHVACVGGREEATVVGHLQGAPAGSAALANGTAGHADEIDGTHITEGHPGAPIVAAALAAGEVGGVSGAELVTAVVAGYDVSTRLVQMVGGRVRLQAVHQLFSDFLHALGASAAAGRLLGLSAAEITNALSLSAHGAIAYPCVYTGADHHLKSFAYGQAASAGVTAAFLAGQGVAGVDDIVGEAIVPAFGAGGVATDFVADLGSRFAILDTNFKFFSAGGPIQAPVEGALAARQEAGRPPAEITSVRVVLGNASADVVGDRDIPSISVRAMVAVALATGRLGVREAHDPDILDHPEVRRLREAVAVVREPTWDARGPAYRGAVVTLHFNDGAEHTASVDHPRGHCLRGDTRWAELTDKFTVVTAPVLGRPAAESLGRQLVRLDTVDDIRSIGAQMRVGPPRSDKRP
jgi:2-methylcitrate dehydratase PrpD